ncbi:hypothetical protein K1X84_08195 [bacterium]|nr:hypothetical protein [bacterium]
MSMQNAQETRKLHSVLQELESQYKVKFSYVDQWIDNVLVHSPQTARGVKSALDEILLKVPISYTILDDKNILLFQDSSKIKPATEFKNEIKGSLIDAHSSQIVTLPDSVLSKDGKDSIDTSSFQQLANADDADDVLIKEQINVIPGNQHFESPKHFFHFSLWNQLNTNYPFSGPTIHNFSMNMISHESIGLEGIEIGLIGNFNRTFVKGFQIALGGNSAQTYMHGLQISGGANVNSLQVSGLQIAGGYNATEKLSGIQIGSANTAKNVTGGQIGGVNLNSVNANGAQIGVLFNRSKTVSGLQLAAVNQSELTTGVQVGLFNFGKKVKGIQVGLVNFSDDNTVAAIGLLNFIKNGQHHFEASMNESKFTHLAYRHGTKYFYTIYDVGVHRFDNPPRWSVGIGVGGVIYNYKMVEVNLDVMTHQLHENRLWERRVNLLNNIKLTPSFKINDHFALYGGVSANVWISRHNNGDVLSRGKVYVYDRKNTFVRGWWGYLVGIRI